MAEVVDHCAKDVMALQDVYLRLKPWLSEEPGKWTTTGETGCPSCGSVNVRRQGTRASVTRVYQRFNCGECGHWFQGARSLGSAPIRSCPS